MILTWFLVSIIPSILIIGFTPVAIFLATPPQALIEPEPAVEEIPPATPITEWVFTGHHET